MSEFIKFPCKTLLARIKRDLIFYDQFSVFLLIERERKSFKMLMSKFVWMGEIISLVSAELEQLKIMRNWGKITQTQTDEKC